MPAGWRCHSWLVPPEVIHPPTTPSPARTGPPPGNEGVYLPAVPPHHPDGQVLPVGGWGGLRKMCIHVWHMLQFHHTASILVTNHRWYILLCRSAANQPIIAAFLPDLPAFYHYLPFQRILAAEVEPSCLLPASPSTPPSTKPPTRPQFPLPRAGPGAGCLRPLWPARWLLFPGRRPAVMNEDALSGASLQSSASTREDYINTPRETGVCA